MELLYHIFIQEQHVEMTSNKREFILGDVHLAGIMGVGRELHSLLLHWDLYRPSGRKNSPGRWKHSLVVIVPLEALS